MQEHDAEHHRKKARRTGVSAHSWAAGLGCGPTVQWSQRAAWSGGGWSGAHAGVGAADLQLVPSHPLWSHPDCLERGGRWWKTLLGDHASQRAWAITALTPHGFTQHRQGPLIFPRKTASLGRPLPAAVLEVEPNIACRSWGVSCSHRDTDRWSECLCSPSQGEGGAVGLLDPVSALSMLLET